MSLTRASILRDLDKQEETEGTTPNIQRIRAMVPYMRTNSDVHTILDMRWNKWGKMSYEADRFWYVKDNMLQLIRAVSRIDAEENNK